MAGLTSLGTVIDLTVTYRVDGYEILQRQFFHHVYTYTHVNCISSHGNQELTAVFK